MLSPKNRFLAFAILAAVAMAGCDYLGPPAEPVEASHAIQATGASAAGAAIAHLKEGILRLELSLDQQERDRETLIANWREKAAGFEAQAPANPTADALIAARGAIGALANDAANNDAFADYLLDNIPAIKAIKGLSDPERNRLSDLKKKATGAKARSEDLLTALKADLATADSLIAKASAAITKSEAASSSTGPRSLIIGEKTGAPFAGMAGRRPLMVIRFATPNLTFEGKLRETVAEAIARRPQAAFDILALSPTGAAAIEADRLRQNANRIAAILIDMGLAPERIAIAPGEAPDVTAGEIRLFVR